MEREWNRTWERERDRDKDRERQSVCTKAIGEYHGNETKKSLSELVVGWWVYLCCATRVRLKNTDKVFSSFFLVFFCKNSYWGGSK